MRCAWLGAVRMCRRREMHEVGLKKDKAQSSWPRSDSLSLCKGSTSICAERFEVLALLQLVEVLPELYDPLA